MSARRTSSLLESLCNHAVHLVYVRLIDQVDKNDVVHRNYIPVQNSPGGISGNTSSSTRDKSVAELINSFLTFRCFLREVDSWTREKDYEAVI